MPTRNPINVRQAPTLRKGPVTLSKRVADRIKAAFNLMGAIEKLKADAAAGFSAKFAAELRPGEIMPDQTLALDLAGRSVMTAIGLLENADVAYCGQAVDRRFLKDACVHVAGNEVYPELSDVRRSIEARYGRQVGRRLHRMEGHTRASRSASTRSSSGW